MKEKKIEPYKNKKQKPFFRFIKFMAKGIYPKRKNLGLENIPKEPAIIVGNHTHLFGPLYAEMYFPYKRYTWCIGHMLHLKEAPPYVFEDFWGHKPKKTHRWYKFWAKMLSPLMVYINKNAYTIGVYKDARGISTFKNSVKALKENNHIIIFPEKHEGFNHVVNEFQDKFVDLARFYYKETGKEISFVPMYNAHELKTVVYGKPIKFDGTKDIGEQRKEICEYLKKEITSLAEGLPRHRVVPYANIKKKHYPYSKEEQSE